MTGNEKVATHYVYIPVYLEPSHRCDYNDLSEALQTCISEGYLKLYRKLDILVSHNLTS